MIKQLHNLHSRQTSGRIEPEYGKIHTVTYCPLGSYIPARILGLGHAIFYLVQNLWLSFPPDSPDHLRVILNLMWGNPLHGGFPYIRKNNNVCVMVSSGSPRSARVPQFPRVVLRFAQHLVCGKPPLTGFADTRQSNTLFVCEGVVA
jgi:hypothetical protein